MKRILLIDHDDPRRATRVLLLQRNGYEVVTANRFEEVEGAIREGEFDLIVVETDDVKKASIAYGERLRAINPHLPILLLSDTGLFLPREVILSRFAESPSPLGCWDGLRPCFWKAAMSAKIPIDLLPLLIYAVFPGFPGHVF
ncbi:MAG TPA: hypothetical protein VIK39_19530 [Candidatus Angelobacter sp.]